MIKNTQKTAVGDAHSKLILVGEHAVVYGQPAIALPHPLLAVKATIAEKAGPIIVASKYYNGLLDDAPEKMQGMVACIKETFDTLQKPPEGLLIRLHSAIPIARGLGSSAAIAIAVVRSLFAYYGKEVSKKQLLALVHIAETYAHGNPSGIDAAAASSAFPIWFQKGHETEPLSISDPFHLVVADSGRSSDTHQAVRSIKEKCQAEPKMTQQSIDKLGEMAYKMRAALADGEMEALGSMFNLAQAELATLGVSDAGLNRLVETACNAGALGAKLTGGGRGGCIIALVLTKEQAKEVAKALRKEGAYETWYFRVDKSERASGASASRGSDRRFHK